MSDTPVARLEAVSHRYSTVTALDNVTIDIPSKVMVGVIGPDGVGKSTLLALISGVRAIQSGKVFVFDQNLAQRENLRTIRGRVAYMPQGLGRNLYPTLSVFENIDFFGRLFGQSTAERRARITELAKIDATLVLFESGARIVDGLQDLTIGLGDREAVICRERYTVKGGLVG